MAIPELGCVSRWARRPSLVRMQQALGVHVEPPDGKDPHRRLDEVEYRRATLRVRGGRDDAVGLVQEEVDLALRGRRELAVDADHLGLGIHAVAEFGDTTVDRDPPLDDEHLTGPSRPISGTREGLLQALALVQLRHLRVVVAADVFRRPARCAVSIGGMNSSIGGRSSSDASPMRSRKSSVVP